MRTALALIVLAFLGAAGLRAQAPAPKRGVMDHVLHPFGGSSNPKAPHYSDPRLRGLLLQITLPIEPLRLSEMRQLHVHVALSNVGSNPVILDFPNAQRIDMQLLKANGDVLTRWSENRAFTEETGTVLVNQHENVVYDESIATRELQSGKVYTLEVFLPKYPELRVRQKFLTAP